MKMRVNTIVTLGASAAFGVLAIFLSRGWINDAVSSQYTGQHPQDAVPEGSYSAYNQLFTDPDRPIVALTKMSMNEPILGFKVSGPDGRGTLSALISKDMRAVGVRVNDVAGVYQLDWPMLNQQ